MNLPDFICIGVQRAGTTWLYECLKEHPEVFVPDQKELHFFNDNYEKGMTFYSDFFKDANSTKQVIGELTPNYYHDFTTLERISQSLPDVKIIFILREPVARAYSHYQLSLTNQCKGMSFDDALDKRPIIKELSMQSIFVKEVFRLFPRERVYIDLYDNLEIQPQCLIQRIYNFIGVDDSFQPSSLNKRINRIIFPELQEFFVKLGLRHFVEQIKKTRLGDMIKEKYNSGDRKKVNTDLVKYKQNFNLDVCELEKIIEQDLSHWK